jgi:recombination protein RecR
MIDNLPSLKYLLRHLQQIPYFASRHVYRIAQHFLEMDQQNLQQFCNVLLHAKENLIKCPTCCVWKEKSGKCLFCDNEKRDKKIVCVVESWYDLWAIERTNSYNGVYHVLGGAICPLEGIGPEDLTIEFLIARVSKETFTNSTNAELNLDNKSNPDTKITKSTTDKKITKSNPENKSKKLDTENIENLESQSISLEIILALNQTPEGEATSAYIAKKLEHFNIKITCLARGMPVGSALENLDRLTVHKALNERRPF